MANDSMLLIERGLRIEAGLLSLNDARVFVASGLVPRCVRALVEPLNADPDDAVALAEAIERALADGAVQLGQVHHGDGIASWAVNRRALAPATASGLVWRTHQSCRMGGRPRETASLSLRPWCY